jgi:Resolvase, N terminal domain
LGKSKRHPASPQRALVAVSRNPARLLEQPCEVEQIPGHEGRVPVREVVLGPPGAGIEVRQAWACLPDPAGVGLGRDRVAKVLERVEVASPTRRSQSTGAAVTDKSKRAIGYVRVSRVGGREGDRFISPELQREQIEAVARREGVQVVEVVQKLDASGGDASRPG